MHFFQLNSGPDTLSTTFTNSFCACQSSSFTDIRLICSVLVEFITSFFHVLTYSWRQWTLASELDFNGFVTMWFGENEHFAVAFRALHGPEIQARPANII